MSRRGRRSRRSLGKILLAAWLLLVAISPASATTLILKDGRRLQGSIGKVGGLSDNPLSSKQAEPATITFIDDDLRRVFLPTFQIGKIDDANASEVKERIAISGQHVAKSGAKVNRVGPAIEITPFDEYGRRTFSMMTNKGRMDVVQGITLVTPGWTKVEGLITQTKTPVIWDMRVATSSIPRDTLRKILSSTVNPKVLEQRLRLVRLFLQSERYQDAQLELEAVVADFPKQKELAKQVQALRQLHARSIVKEIGVRKQSGQHELAFALLDGFPAQDVSGEVLQQVREMLAEYRDQQKRREQIFSELTGYAESIQEGGTREQCTALIEEMDADMKIGTLERLAAYSRFASDMSLSPEQKLSLALGGWLVGANKTDTNLNMTLSMARIRNHVRKFLTEPVKLEREQVYKALRGQEGFSAEVVANLIAHMKPPLESPEPSVSEPGFYSLEVPIGLEKEPDVKYYVQLPPEYDPYVRYPTIVTLRGTNTTPKQQIDWWAGPWLDGGGTRLGQATRLGYIVISVDWLKAGQEDYEYSAREHAAVLSSLRDACRRFSINTDRVFLTGHSSGGSAAWDLGLAHPDLWAGVLPIAGQSSKYCSLYWENAERLPFYVVVGELDSASAITKDHARDLDRYMTKRFDVTVTEYQGRGHEDFSDDVQNMFDWMGRRDGRNFFPKQFSASTMRSWDNYFWWLEAGKLPERSQVDPEDWPPARGVRPAKIAGRVLATNGVAITSAASKFTVWLSPELIKFDQPVRITLNETSISKATRISPDISVMLEDVRTRGDRQHPFWAKIEQ